jgi:hypothetical protein
MEMGIHGVKMGIHGVDGGFKPFVKSPALPYPKGSPNLQPSWNELPWGDADPRGVQNVVQN